MNPTDHFDHAVMVVLRHEGGYVDNPSDPGGATNFGISKRSYPDLDIANLTELDAKAIYRRDWWDRYGYENLPPFIAVKVFDLSVNMGPGAAHRCLQRALHACGLRHVTVDGHLGPQTFSACAEVDAGNLLCVIRAEAAWHYRRLIEGNDSQRVFEKGWMNRAYS